MSTQTSGEVLLLGDDATGDDTVTSVLRARGIRVAAFADPVAGMEHATAARLIIIDRIGEGRDAVALCARIRAMPELVEKLVLCLASSEDVEERVRFLEAGADDVISRPFDGRELDARVDALLARTQRSRASMPATAPGDPVRDVPRLVGFYGPKGGTGASTLAVNVATALAARGDRSVALADLDLQWGDVATLLNVKIRQTVSELARDASALAEAGSVQSYAAMHSSGLAVFGSAGRPDEAESVGAEHLGQLLIGLRDAYDMVLVDTASTFDSRTLTIFEHVDRLVVPVTAEIPALRAVRTLLDALGELEQGTAGVLPVLIHRQEHERLRRAEVAEALGVSVVMEIPFDAAFHAAANTGEPLVTAAPRSSAAIRLGALAASIIGEPPPAAGKEVSPDRRQRLGSLLKRGSSDPRP